jgi:tetratricopeptide (TPR) repeat protein
MDAPSPGGPLTSAERCAYELGRRRFQRGEVDGALAELSRLLETRRGFADVHYMVAVLLERKNRIRPAVESLQEALRLNPSYTEALLALASLYERQGEFERSRELAARARDGAPQAAGALDATTRGKLANLQAELGDAFRDAGELPDAIEAYRRALDRCPDFHDIRHRLGIALREAGLPDRALAEFARVQRGNPAFLDASVQRGVTLYSLGRSAEAVAQWSEVLERDPGRGDARMYLRLVSRDATEPAPAPGSVSEGGPPPETA